MNERRIIRSRRSLVAVAALAGSLALLDAAVAMPEDYQELLETANRLSRENKLKKAAQAFLDASETASGSPVEALLGLGAVYYRMEKYQDAARTAEQILQLTEEESARFGGYNLLGISLFGAGDGGESELAEAEAALRRAVELGGTRATASRYTLARVLQATGRQSEALTLTRGLLAEAPDDPIADRTRVLHCGLRRELAEEPEKSIGGGEPRILAEGEPRPSVIDAPPPYYTPEARRAGVQGKVVAQAIITKEGCVVQTQVLEGLSHGLNEVAEDTMSQWVFRPAVHDGNAVSVYRKLTINFSSRKRVRVAPQ